MTVTPAGLSIIICTYNPDETIFRRLIKAVEALEQPTNMGYEIIIVDNNSSKPLEDIEYVKGLAARKLETAIITEKKPGLTSARIAGAKAAKYNWLIFFDDDNEPYPSYLVGLSRALDMYPNVGCWGPGNITVEYIGKVSSWVIGQKEFFQEKHEHQIKFDTNIVWQNWYPYGTGMAVKKEVVEVYAEGVVNGTYSLNDRKGKSLSSGGDVQIVLCCLKNGYAAGILPNLHLKHLIQADKSNLKYLLKMVYGTASSYLQAHNQIFSEHQIQPVLVSNTTILKNVYGVVKRHMLKTPLKNICLKIAQMAGEAKGAYNAVNKKSPIMLDVIEKTIGYK